MICRSLIGTAAAALLALAAPAQAAPVLDCPLRDMPFSMQSPMIDILLSPAAKAVVDRKLGGLLDKLPKQMFGTTAPSFASILTIKEAAGFATRGGGAMPDLTGLDEELAKIPVTAADRTARCVRYDDDRPTFKLPAGKPRILLFEKMTGFRDGPSVDAAHAAFTALAERKGWALVSTLKGGAIHPSVLKNFDAVIWNNVSGDVLTLSQRKALQAFVKGGGGFVAVHGSAGDFATFWDWYVDDLIGARFAGHPMSPQFQDARVVVEAKDSPLAKGLPAEWVMKDEWYSFRNNPRASGSTIIATLDEKSYKPDGLAGQNLRMGDDHPVAWTRCIGKGRMFYSAIGHRPETYSEPHYVTMLENALGWATGTACAAPASAQKPASAK
ncbi:ThuA domain-containing protein [Sphingobium sufflavum]|uniref:ThuA domain-containing protein n=1 Tax=Sphingobium sufflavum TaxID=1129547 RepID=UPI001F378F18|nr:ThuA domain-containing protein [Sphingobium sufflavum]MCE7796332.1 ThuA domain-containing protein [Sphingobium sufflavum]